MRFLTDKIAKLKIGWNERSLTEADFHRICRRLRVHVVEMPLMAGGFYYRVRGRDYIAVDSRLAGTDKLLVMLHELGHCLLHTPESGATANFHGVGRKTRIETEADVFALCALVPRSSIAGTSDTSADLDGYPSKVVDARLRIYERYGL